MKKLIIITIALLLVSSAFAQVDTLMLVEINSIEINDEIAEIYTEDLNNDLNKEIILCTEHFIYVYDSFTNDLLWTSPPLTNPQDLRFADINNDGFTDISVQDSLNIYLFDIMNSENIWTSPEISQMYKCYTLGDRNNDSNLDVIIAYLNESNAVIYDTTWLDIHDGPNFSMNIRNFILLPNYFSSDGNWSLEVNERPIKILSGFLNNNDSLFSLISIFTSFHSTSMGHSYYHEIYTGSLFNFNSFDLSYIHFDNIGWMQYNSLTQINDALVLACILFKGSVGFDYTEGWIELRTYSFDSLCTNEQLFYSYSSPNHPGNYWWNFVIDDITDSNPGNEICYGTNEEIYLKSFPELTTIWTTINSIHHCKGIIKYQMLFNCVQVLYTCPEDHISYYVFNGTDGILNAVITEQNLNFTCATDLNADGNDEILSIDGNTLRIYHLDYYTDIDQPATIPYHTFLQPSYPNPFNTSTTIEYGLASDKHVTIEIYDLLGRKVQTLIDENKPAGLHQVTWHAGDMPSGIYFYKIVVGDFTKTRKMILLK